MKKDNELIAEFMGWNKQIVSSKMEGGYKDGTILWHSDEGVMTYLEFDSSWSWLMPVVERIASLGYDFHIQINNKYTKTLVRDIGGEPMVQMATHNSINDVYLAVVATIKHHGQK